MKTVRDIIGYKRYVFLFPASQTRPALPAYLCIHFDPVFHGITR